MRKKKRKIEVKGWRPFKIGDTVEGTVQSIHPFGAFVDIGGLQALCPKRFFNRVQGGVQEGLSLLLEIEQHRYRRQGLGQTTIQDPWITAAEKYSIGQKIFRHHSQSHRLWIFRCSGVWTRGTRSQKEQNKSALVSTTRSWI